MAKQAGTFSAVHYGGYDLTGRSNQWDFLADYGEMDLTAFQEPDNAMPGVERGEANLTAFLDPATNNSHDALKSAGGYTGKCLSIILGQNATPTVGDPALAMIATEFDYRTPIATRSAVIANARFVNQGAYRPDVFGVCLVNTTITNTATGTTVDQLAATTLAGAAYLQILTPVATDSYAIKVQHSTDGSAWVDKATFTANGQSRTSERLALTGTINRYVRYVATRTGSAGQSLKLSIVLARFTYL